VQCPAQPAVTLSAGRAGHENTVGICSPSGIIRKPKKTTQRWLALYLSVMSVTVANNASPHSSVSE